MQDDLIMHFTDDKYCDVEDIRAELGIHNVDSIMQKQLKYRSLFIAKLELKNYEDKNFCFCMSPGVVYRFATFEKHLTRVTYLFSKLAREDEAAIIKESTLRIGNYYASFNNLKVTDDYLIYLLNEENISQEFKVLANYLISLKNNLYHDVNYNEKTLKTIFKNLISSNHIDDIDDIAYRDENLVNHRDIYQENVAPEKINICMNDLLTFINGYATFPSLKAIIAYFYILYVKPFDLANEETALMTLKYLLTDNEGSLVSTILPLEEILFDNKNLEKIYVKSLVSRDLTYYILEILTILENKLKEFESRIEKYIKEEVPLTIGEIIAKREETYQNNDEVVKETPQIKLEDTFNVTKKVSLPTLPVGLNEDEATIIAENLQELYPSLKRLQCIFYSKHCTIGKYYSISQYKKEMGVVYETARTSMDNLANVGLYKKEFVGNKFVYTPLNQEGDK